MVKQAKIGFGSIQYPTNIILKQSKGRATTISLYLYYVTVPAHRPQRLAIMVILQVMLMVLRSKYKVSSRHLLGCRPRTDANPCEDCGLLWTPFNGAEKLVVYYVVSGTP